VTRNLAEDLQTPQPEHEADLNASPEPLASIRSLIAVDPIGSDDLCHDPDTPDAITVGDLTMVEFHREALRSKRPVTAYAFGDSDLAALRLAKVHELFAPTSRAFLNQCSYRSDIHLAIDLGCGPGHTTHLLAETVTAHMTVGFDSSQHFVALATQTVTDAVSFLEHDVTAVPFPRGPADIIYCRFLLTHLVGLGRLIADWGSQLQPGGLLLLDEVESIETADPSFASYLGIVSSMLEHRRACLSVGPLLASLENPAGLKRRIDSLATLDPPPAKVAEMFLANLRVWRHDAFVRAHHRGAEIDTLEHRLALIATGQPAETISWSLRQIAFQRMPDDRN